jgi:hypothetical protein
MDNNNIEYKGGKLSIKWKLWIAVAIIWASFAYIYFYLYQQNRYNFYLPSQQEQNRLIIDSTNITDEINRLSIKLNECCQVLEQDEVELKGVSRIRNNFSIEPTPKKGDTFNLRGDTTYQAVILKLNDNCIIGDTLFRVLNKQTQKIYYCKLKLPDEEWAKVSKGDPNSNYSIKSKLSKYEDIVRDELENLNYKQKNLNRNIKQLANKQSTLNTNSILTYFDFLIFSANIHTTLGFNGIIPTSSILRFICVLHKLLALYFYYLLYTKYKTKKKEED